MGYYDSSAVLPLQIRDRLRDLLEADESVRAVYDDSHSIYGLPKDVVSETERFRVSVSLVDEDFGVAASQTHDDNPQMMLVCQRFIANDKDFDLQGAHDELVTLTSTVRLALLAYQCEPAPLAGPVRLWDEIRFPRGRTTTYDKHATKFWYSVTLFQMFSYQRNP